MAGSGSPDVAVGNHVKFYQAPNYARQDGTVIALKGTRKIDVRGLKGGPIVRDVVHVNDSNNTTPAYYTELPNGWLPE